jgi:hypothetical protein
MAAKKDLVDWVVKALEAHGGQARLVDISRFVWQNYEAILNRVQFERHSFYGADFLSIG